MAVFCEYYYDNGENALKGLRMEIIKYDAQYAEEVVDLNITVFSQAPWNETFDRKKVVAFVNNQAANNYFNGYLGIEAGAVVAVSLGFMKPWYDGFEYYIEEFFVAPSVQRSGRGTAMMAAIRDDLLQQDIHAIILMTRRNSFAHQFYTQDGFNTEADLVVLDSYFKWNNPTLLEKGAARNNVAYPQSG